MLYCAKELSFLVASFHGDCGVGGVGHSVEPQSKLFLADLEPEPDPSSNDRIEERRDSRLEIDAVEE